MTFIQRDLMVCAPNIKALRFELELKQIFMIFFIFDTLVSVIFDV